MAQLEKHARAFQLNGQTLGTGGEATVYEGPDLPQLPPLVVKVYHKPTPERADKLAAMIANPPADPMAGTGHVSIAWPLDRVFTPSQPSPGSGEGRVGVCLGYIMPRVDRARSIFEFYNPRSRLQSCPLFHYGYLLRTARNLASAVQAIHDRGYVIGDVNESNILVTNTALVTLVDTDSFQVPVKARIHRCPVGKPEYTPPELQGANFPDIDRRPEHDAFGLGVLIFQLLMQGIHPFLGRFTGQGEPPALNRRISEGTWPYVKKRQTTVAPMPHAPPYEMLPPQIQDLMRRCFEEGHDKPAARPMAGQWFKALRQAEEELMPCRTNPQHLYHKSLDSCPWCALARRQGRDVFPPAEQPSRMIASPPPVRRPPVTQAPRPTAAATAPRTAAPVLPRPAARSAARPLDSSRERSAGVPPAVAAGTAALQQGSRFIWTTVAVTAGLTLLIAIVVTVIILAASSGDSKQDHDNVARTSNPSPPTPGPNPPIIFPSNPKQDRVNPNPLRPPIQPPVRPPVQPQPESTIFKATRTFLGHTNWVMSVALSPDGRYALSGSADHSMRLWDVATAQEVRGFVGHASFVSSVAFSPDGRLALSGSWDKTVRLWNVETGKELGRFAGPTDHVEAVAFSRDGKRIVAGSWDQRVRVWDVDTAKVVCQFQGHGARIKTVAYSPNGRQVLSGCEGTDVILWNIQPAGEARRFPGPGMPGGHTRPISAVAFSSTGRYAFSASEDKTVRVWDVETGKEIRRLEAKGTPQCLTVSPDDRYVLAGDNSYNIQAWELETGKEYSDKRRNYAFRSLAFATDGRTFLSGGTDVTTVGAKTNVTGMMLLWDFPDFKAPPFTGGAKAPE